MGGRCRYCGCKSYLVRALLAISDESMEFRLGATWYAATCAACGWAAESADTQEKAAKLWDAPPLGQLLDALKEIQSNLHRRGIGID